MDRSFLRRNAPALFAFLLALALRLIALGQLADSPYWLPVTGDMKFYADWGRRIAAGELTDFHAFYGQPLYAYLLGAIFAVAGFQPFWVGLLQALLDAATALLIYKIATHVFEDSPRKGAVIGFLAAIGWAFYVPAAAYCGLLIPSAFVTASWWFTVWWLLRRSAAARWLEWFCVALLVGLVALISAATIFLLALAVVAAIQHRRGAALLAIAAGLALGTAPAWGHNIFVARDPVFISAHGGLNFWIGNNPEANGYPKIPSALPSDQAALLQESIRVAERSAGHSLPRSRVSKYWSARAREYIAFHPLEWMALLGVKLKNFWSAFRYDDLSSITPLRDAGIILPGLHFGILAALGLPGALFAYQNRKARWIIAAVVLQMLALLPVFVNERYRLPAAPGLLLLSAFFAVTMSSCLVAKRWRQLAAGALALIASTIFVALPPADPALRSVDDFKAGRRQLIANDFARAESRLRRAAAVVSPAQETSPMVAKLFAEFALEKWQAGDDQTAIRTITAACRINPDDKKLRELRTAFETSAHP